MKKLVFLILVFIFIIIPITSLIAKENSIDVQRWAGLVRFKPLATLVALSIGISEINVDFIPYINTGVGVPISIDLVFANGILGFGLLSGVEITPNHNISPAGFYFTFLGGLNYITNGYITYLAIGGKTDIGYQFITEGGFVFTPAAGIKYVPLIGLMLDIILDIGFAYK